MRFKFAPFVQKTTLHKVVPHSLVLKQYTKKRKKNQNWCTYLISTVNGNRDNQVCSPIQLLIFSLHNIMLRNIVQCGKINLPSQIGHNNHLLHHHHGRIKQANLIGQIFPTPHHIGKTMHIQHNGPLPLCRVKPSRQTGKDQ